jgi:hypothetical protein
LNGVDANDTSKLDLQQFSYSCAFQCKKCNARLTPVTSSNGSKTWSFQHGTVVTPSTIKNGLKPDNPCLAECFPLTVLKKTDKWLPPIEIFFIYPQFWKLVHSQNTTELNKSWNLFRTTNGAQFLFPDDTWGCKQVDTLKNKLLIQTTTKKTTNAFDVYKKKLFDNFKKSHNDELLSATSVAMHLDRRRKLTGEVVQSIGKRQTTATVGLSQTTTTYSAQEDMPYSPNFSPAEANMDAMNVQESDKDVVNNSDDMQVEYSPVSANMQVEICPLLETRPNYAYSEVDGSELEILGAATTAIEEADKNPSSLFKQDDMPEIVIEYSEDNPFLLHPNAKAIDNDVRCKLIKNITGQDHLDATLFLESAYPSLYEITESDIDINTYKSVKLRTYSNPGRKTCFMHTGLVCFILSSIDVKRCIIEKHLTCRNRDKHGLCCSHCKWFLFLRFYGNRRNLNDVVYYRNFYKPFVVRFLYDLIEMNVATLQTTNAWYDVQDLYLRIQEDLGLFDRHSGAPILSSELHPPFINDLDDFRNDSDIVGYIAYAALLPQIKPGSYTMLETFDSCKYCQGKGTQTQSRKIELIRGSLRRLNPIHNEASSYLLSTLLHKEYPICANIDDLIPDLGNDSMESCPHSQMHNRLSSGCIQNYVNSRPTTLILSLERFNEKKFDNTPVDIEYSITVDGGKYILKAITMADEYNGTLCHYYPILVMYPTTDSESISFQRMDVGKLFTFTTNIEDSRSMHTLRTKSTVFTYELEEDENATTTYRDQVFEY